MRATPFIALALVMGSSAAEAAFRTEPLDGRSRYRLLAQGSGAGALTPPPLLPVPDGDVEEAKPGPAAAPQPPTPRAQPPSPPSAMDRLAEPPREVTFGRRILETLLALGAIVGVDAVAAGTIFVGLLVALVAGLAASPPVVAGALTVAVIGALELIILPPVLAAAAVGLVADPKEHGGYERAIVAAAIFHGIALVITGVITAIVTQSPSAWSTFQAPLIGAGSLAALLHFVAAPIAASVAYHSVPASRAAIPPTPRTERLRPLPPASPSQVALMERRAPAITLAAFAF